MDYEISVAEPTSTMAAAATTEATNAVSVYHEALQVQTREDAAIYATAVAAGVSAEDVLEAAMEGYQNHNKRPLVVVVDDPSFDPNKRMRLSAGDPLYPKKVNSEQWDSMFERVKEYKLQHGDCLVPKRYAADPKLGTWVETQRVQYKRLPRTTDESNGHEIVQPNKRLNAERLQKLESIGFAWSAKHVRKSGPKKQAAASSANSNTDMAEPAATACMMMVPTTMTPNTAAAAEHPPPRGRQRLNEAQWEDMYHRLVQYKEEHSNCLVPRKYEKDPKLATWVETQRVLWNRDYRKQTESSSSLTTPAEIGMPLVSSVGEVDGGGPAVLLHHPLVVDAVAIVGTTMMETDAAAVDTTTPPQDPLLLLQQQEQQQLPSMTIPDSTCLSPPPIPTEICFIEDGNNNNNNNSTHNNNNTNAAAAAAAIHKIKRLTPERKTKLDQLGFVWSLRSKRIEDHWDEMFRQLVEYKNGHGDCLVPSRYETNLKLGKWVETQRYEYTKLQRAAMDTETKSEVSSEGGGSAPARPPTSTNPRLTEDRLRRLGAIGFEWKVKHKMKRYYDKQWDQMFNRLLAFKKDTGHCMVPKRYPPDMKLGTWVHTQRIQYRKLMAGKKEPTEEEKTLLGEEVTYRLTDERRKRLEEAGFVWSAREGEKGSETGRITRNSYDDQWDTMFEKLKEYKEHHGCCLVPKRYKENPKLGTWVDTQRVQFKKLKKKLAEEGKTYEVDEPVPVAVIVAEAPTATMSPKPLVGRLTDERIRRLQNLGFVWSLRDDWQKHYDELKTYKQEHGHCNVPARYTKNRRLGIWVSAQRQQFKIMNQAQQQQDSTKPRRSAPLTDDRIKLLNDIEFTWTIRSRDSLGESWNQRLEELKEFKAQHGHCLVASRYAANPELGIWVGTQRTQYRLYMRAKETGMTLTGSTAMNEERIRELTELGFIWALRGSEGRKDPMEEAVAAAEAAAAVEAADVVGAMDEHFVAEI